PDEPAVELGDHEISTLLDARRAARRPRRDEARAPPLRASRAAKQASARIWRVGAESRSAPLATHVDLHATAPSTSCSVGTVGASTSCSRAAAMRRDAAAW